MNIASAHTGMEQYGGYHGFEFVDGIVGVIVVILVTIGLYIWRKKKNRK